MKVNGKTQMLSRGGWIPLPEVEVWRSREADPTKLAGIQFTINDELSFGVSMDAEAVISLRDALDSIIRFLP